MRGSGWLPFLGAVAVVAVSAVYPLCAGVIFHVSSRSADSAEPLPDLFDVTLRTAAWAAAIATVALFAGWWPGRVLGGLRSRVAMVFAGSLCLLPICLPDYLLYWSWWQAWPIDSAIHRWAIEHDQIGLARHATLFLGLVCWCWPITAWLVAASGIVPERAELLMLESRSRLRRNLLLARDCRGALALAWIITFALVSNHTTSFDLAQVRTLGFELRAMIAEGYDTSSVIAAAWPSAALLILAGLAIAIVLVRREEASGAARPLKLSPASFLAAALIFSVCTIVPLFLLWRDSIDRDAIDALRAGYARAAMNTAMTAGAAGALAALAAPGFGAAFCDRRRAVRVVAGVVAAGWIISALLPAAAVAVALEAAYNTPFPRSIAANLGIRFDEDIYRSGAVMVFGHLARFGVVAALLGWWLARAEDPVMREMREIEDGGTLRGLCRAGGPRWVGAGLAAFAIVFALSVGEVGLTALVQPPGFDAISAILLNNMHYQRDDLVLLMGRALTIISLSASLVAAALILPPGWRRARIAVAGAAPVFIAACTLLLVGCEEPNHAESKPRSDARVLVGEPGRSIGQFIYPRAMDVDPAREVLYVIDRSGRVQRFGLDGEFQKQWLLPAYDNGYPTGVTVAPDGRVFVADTHEHRISIFTAEGVLLEKFGEFGTGPGQFIFPSDVAFGPDGRIYVSEFGENDRIQVFEPDWTFVRQFGRFGSAPGEFNRPQALAFSSNGTELFVADACNHRIQVFDPEGNLLRVLGSAGTESGKFRYPYGIVRVDDDFMAITEFGNHRVQVIAPDGTPVFIIGSPGEGAGELVAPWTSAVLGADLYVLDSRNSRIQVFPQPGQVRKDG